MAETIVHLQPGYILRHQPYRETSLIIDVLTRDFGVVSILAKGVRKPKSKIAALLRPFQPLYLSYRGRTELKTLTHAEAVHVSIPLQGMSLYCGFYINELIANFLHKFDPYPEVFQLYQQCLVEMAENIQIERVLRIFELNLLISIGYGLQLDFDSQNNKPVAATKRYFFNADYGPVEDEDGDIAGQTLLALQTRNFPDTETLAEAKKLMRTAIDFHLQGKPLKSREVIAKILKQ
ncbi:MAG: DNA repair protein RecO [Gammaproteobacteria bacterium]